MSGFKPQKKVNVAFVTVRPNSDKTERYQVGDHVVVIHRPTLWSSGAGGACPMTVPNLFPYEGVIRKIILRDGDFDALIGYYGFCLTTLVHSGLIRHKEIKTEKPINW